MQAPLTLLTTTALIWISLGLLPAAAQQASNSKRPAKLGAPKAPAKSKTTGDKAQPAVAAKPATETTAPTNAAPRPLPEETQHSARYDAAIAPLRTRWPERMQILPFHFGSASSS